MNSKKQTVSKSPEQVSETAGGIAPKVVARLDVKKQISYCVRPYDDEGEQNRELVYKQANTRIDQSYKRVVDDNLWNEKQRLSPRQSQFHKDTHSFRIAPKDLELIAYQERVDSFNDKMRSVTQQRKESLERYHARKLERQLVQLKSNQPLPGPMQDELFQLEEQDPRLVEELLLKKKWRNVQKDPARAVNDQHMDVSSYWQQLNQLPQKSVDNCVNPRILRYDKDSCDYILKRIITQKDNEDKKRGIQMQERQKLRERLRDKHNQTMELEKYCGVRLGMGSAGKNSNQASPRDANNQQDVEMSLEEQLRSNSQAHQQHADDAAMVGAELSRNNNEISAIENQNDPTRRINSQFDSTLNSLMRDTQANGGASTERQQETGFNFKFNGKQPYRHTEHVNVLAMPKPEYQGRDFFQRSEFRGLLLADYQEAIGEKAFECVDTLNKNTVSKFSQLKSFKDALTQKKKLESFYKGSITSSNQVFGNSAVISAAPTSQRTRQSVSQGQPGSMMGAQMVNPRSRVAAQGQTMNPDIMSGRTGQQTSDELSQKLNIMRFGVSTSYDQQNQQNQQQNFSRTQNNNMNLPAVTERFAQQTANVFDDRQATGRLGTSTVSNGGGVAVTDYEQVGPNSSRLSQYANRERIIKNDPSPMELIPELATNPFGLTGQNWGMPGSMHKTSPYISRKNHTSIDTRRKKNQTTMPPDLAATSEAESVRMQLEAFDAKFYDEDTSAPRPYKYPAAEWTRVMGTKTAQLGTGRKNGQTETRGDHDNTTNAESLPMQLDRQLH